MQTKPKVLIVGHSGSQQYYLEKALIRAEFPTEEAGCISEADKILRFNPNFRGVVRMINGNGYILVVNSDMDSRGLPDQLVKRTENGLTGCVYVSDRIGGTLEGISGAIFTSRSENEFGDHLRRIKEWIGRQPDPRMYGCVERAFDAFKDDDVLGLINRIGLLSGSIGNSHVGLYSCAYCGSQGVVDFDKLEKALTQLKCGQCCGPLSLPI